VSPSVCSKQVALQGGTVDALIAELERIGILDQEAVGRIKDDARRQAIAHMREFDCVTRIEDYL
jgi:hypothetical protein